MNKVTNSTKYMKGRIMFPIYILNMKLMLQLKKMQNNLLRLNLRDNLTYFVLFTGFARRERESGSKRGQGK